jgi:hypothetical protein
MSYKLDGDWSGLKITDAPATKKEELQTSVGLVSSQNSMSSEFLPRLIFGIVYNDMRGNFQFYNTDNDDETLHPHLKMAVLSTIWLSL